MAVVRRFEELDCWQVARELCQAVYRACQSPPMRNEYALVGQMKRAAISISSNIAEGFERGSRKQQVEFCFVAKGSAGELRSQVILAHDNGLIDQETYDRMHSECERCSRLIYAYIRSMQRSAESFPGLKFGEK